jgi:hypothetical protein
MPGIMTESTYEGSLPAHMVTLAWESGGLAGVLEDDAHQQAVLNVAKHNVGFGPLHTQPEGVRLHHAQFRLLTLCECGEKIGTV